MANITNITEALDVLKDLAEALPTAVTVDDTLIVEGAAADAKAVGDAIAEIQTNLETHTANTSNPHGVTAAQIGAAKSSHTQAASTITAGTFAGAVVAQTTSQTPATSLLRNSKLVTTATSPSNNGEIFWTYE